ARLVGNGDCGNPLSAVFRRRSSERSDEIAHIVVVDDRRRRSGIHRIRNFIGEAERSAFYQSDVARNRRRELARFSYAAKDHSLGGSGGSPQKLQFESVIRSVGGYGYFLTRADRNGRDDVDSGSDDIKILSDVGKIGQFVVAIDRAYGYVALVSGGIAQFAR